MRPPRKLTFQEAWETSTIFFVDDDLENEIDARVNALLQTAKSPLLTATRERTLQDVLSLLEQEKNGLDVILRDIGLSDEKFMRIVSLLRKIGRIPGGFDKEWNIRHIKRQLRRDSSFRQQIASLLFAGVHDKELYPLIPRYYLEKLNYRELGNMPPALRKVRYKEATIGTYGARKGYSVEARIRSCLEDIKIRHGVGYEKGRSRFVNVDIDFAIPSLEDPWVIVMSSFQETTSSGQTTKARDMLAAYTRIRESNSRFNEQRVFVNFVDGGGWLARKRDLERLVDQCHYFLNLQNLDLLEGIVLTHVPSHYFNPANKPGSIER
ncbi:hypothetical protein D6833_08785 [Candidatus Parcubacteria bacterium]|nr:MAG: hypothetical protein D6833_08785 [Candidatus Parcubacteria bacterium]